MGGAANLMPRIDQARSRLQEANGLLSEAKDSCNRGNLSESIACGISNKLRDIPGEILEYGGDVLTGAGEAIQEELSGLWNTITNPIETAKDTWEGVKEAVSDPEQAAKEAWEDFTEPYREDWNNGRQGEAIGRGVVEVLIPGKALVKGLDILKGLGRRGDGDSGSEGSSDSSDPPPIESNESNDDGNDSSDEASNSNGVIQGEGFTLKESKFDYFFGRVTSSPHNTQRSQQNLEDLRELGIEETGGGRERLLQIFEEGKNAPEVGTRHITEYGVTITRRVEVTGGESSGAIDIKYFYPNNDLSATPEVSTIIPKIYK